MKLDQAIIVYMEYHKTNSGKKYNRGLFQNRPLWGRMFTCFVRRRALGAD